MFPDGSGGGKVEDGDFVKQTAVEDINVLREEMGLVEGRKVVSKEFLGPSAEDVNWPIVFKDLIQGYMLQRAKTSNPRDTACTHPRPSKTQQLHQYNCDSGIQNQCMRRRPCGMVEGEVH